MIFIGTEMCVSSIKSTNSPISVKIKCISSIFNVFNRVRVFNNSIFGVY